MENKLNILDLLLFRDIFFEIMNKVDSGSVICFGLTSKNAYHYYTNPCIFKMNWLF